MPWELDLGFDLAKDAQGGFLKRWWQDALKDTEEWATKRGGKQRSLSVGGIRCHTGESEVASLAELRLQELVENEWDAGWQLISEFVRLSVLTHFDVLLLSCAYERGSGEQSYEQSIPLYVTVGVLLHTLPLFHPHLEAKGSGFPGSTPKAAWSPKALLGRRGAWRVATFRKGATLRLCLAFSQQGREAPSRLKVSGMPALLGCCGLPLVAWGMCLALLHLRKLDWPHDIHWQDESKPCNISSSSQRKPLSQKFIGVNGPSPFQQPSLFCLRDNHSNPTHPWLGLSPPVSAEDRVNPHQP